MTIRRWYQPKPTPPRLFHNGLEIWKLLFSRSIILLCDKFSYPTTVGAILFFRFQLSRQIDDARLERAGRVLPCSTLASSPHRALRSVADQDESATWPTGCNCSASGEHALFGLHRGA